MKILFISVPAFYYHPYNNNSVIERLSLSYYALKKRGHDVKILAPQGSIVDEDVIPVNGELHPNMSVATIQEYLFSSSSVIFKMFEYAKLHEKEYDFIVSVGQDYLNYYLIPFFSTPFLLIPNLCHSIKETDELLLKRYNEYPNNINFLTKAQKKYITNSLADQLMVSVKGQSNLDVLWEPMNIGNYYVSPKKEKIFWAGRIFYGKGLHNVCKVCEKLNLQLVVAGSIEDNVYFQEIKKQYNFDYLGVLDRKGIATHMSESKVFFQLQEDTFIEAFGRITAEALLSGTPVICFDNGANTELVSDGETGFVVKNLDEAVDVYQRAILLDSKKIKEKANLLFNPERHAENMEKWFQHFLNK